jgi:glycosyltransferase involved in cell wall biosynthesis
MLFFSSSVGKGFGGDFIYTRQITTALKSVSELLIVKIKQIQLKNNPFLLVCLPLFFIFPYMWRPMFRLENSRMAIKHISELHPMIVIDHFRNAWVILLLLLVGQRQIFLVTHNIEHMIAKENYAGKSIFIRYLYYFEYLKLRFWEKIIFKKVSFITAITEEDAEEMRSYCDNIMVVKPYKKLANYDASISLSQSLTALIIGSFNWKIKQDNLISLLETFDLAERPAGFEILIAGSMPKSFSTRLIKKFSFVKLSLDYSQIDVFLNIARLAIAPDQVGGGFKLKVLDYLYLGLPVFGLEKSMNGINVEAQGVIKSNDYPALVDSVLSDIENIDKLQNMSKCNQELLRDTFSQDVMEKQLKDLISRRISI